MATRESAAAPKRKGAKVPESTTESDEEKLFKETVGEMLSGNFDAAVRRREELLAYVERPPSAVRPWVAGVASLLYVTDLRRQEAQKCLAPYVRTTSDSSLIAAGEEKRIPSEHPSGAGAALLLLAAANVCFRYMQKRGVELARQGVSLLRDLHGDQFLSAGQIAGFRALAALWTARLEYADEPDTALARLKDAQRKVRELRQDNRGALDPLGVNALEAILCDAIAGMLMDRGLLTEARDTAWRGLLLFLTTELPPKREPAREPRRIHDSRREGHLYFVAGLCASYAFAEADGEAARDDIGIILLEHSKAAYEQTGHVFSWRCGCQYARALVRMNPMNPRDADDALTYVEAEDVRLQKAVADRTIDPFDARLVAAELELARAWASERKARATPPRERAAEWDRHLMLVNEKLKALVEPVDAEWLPRPLLAEALLRYGYALLKGGRAPGKALKRLGDAYQKSSRGPITIHVAACFALTEAMLESDAPDARNLAMGYWTQANRLLPNVNTGLLRAWKDELAPKVFAPLSFTVRPGAKFAEVTKLVREAYLQYKMDEFDNDPRLFHDGTGIPLPTLRLWATGDDQKQQLSEEIRHRIKTMLKGKPRQKRRDKAD